MKQLFSFCLLRVAKRFYIRNVQLLKYKPVSKYRKQIKPVVGKSSFVTLQVYNACLNAT